MSEMLMNRKTKFSLAFCALFLMPGLLWAEDKTHDGFFLNMSFGFGLSGSFTDSPPAGGGEDNKFESSSTGILNFKIGGSITPNWALHLNLGGISEGSAGTDLDGTAKYAVSSRAIGATYYFISDNPYLSNLYISPEYRFAVNGATEFTSTDGLFAEEITYKGSGFGFSIGKEWWLSPNWGLGAALFYHSDSLDGEKRRYNKSILIIKEDYEGSASVNHFGIQFSATYN